MNSSTNFTDTPRETPLAQTPRTNNRARSRSSWLISLTAVCFLFGGLTAMQLRAIETVRDNKAKEAQSLQNQQVMLTDVKAQLVKEAEQSKNLQVSLDEAKNKLAAGSTLSKQQADKLNSEIKKMQTVAGLTSVQGPGIVMKLTDDPEVAKTGALPSGFAPGIVHDYDVLQVVNELRSAKAEAVSINGTRITAYTPIRCVGPAILINWEPAAAPFIVKAIGDPDRLASAVSMPNGIVDNLRGSGGITVNVSKADALDLPAAEGVPTMKVLKPEQP